MTDGPFKNAELTSRWKQYGKDLVSDAASPDERAAQACHSILGDVDMKTLGPLLSALKAHAHQTQVELDPVSSFEAIFEKHPNSPLVDTIQKHLIAQLRDQAPTGRALDRAFQSAVANLIDTTRNRLDEECIRARDRGDMTQENCLKGIDRNHEAFKKIDSNDLGKALTSGNRHAFKDATRKKVGVDEGPDG